MKLNAKTRLLATEDPVIEQKKQQIENLKRSMPSRQNRMQVSPHQKLNTQKQINQVKDQILDRRAENEAKKNREGNKTGE